MRLSRRVWLVATGAAMGLSAVACLSPTLPLPPPAVPDIEEIGPGQYRLTGTIPIPGTVRVYDVRSTLGFTVPSAHDYQLDIVAKPGDPMRVFYESGDEVSDFTPFKIPLATPAPSSTHLDAGAGPSTDAAAD